MDGPFLVGILQNKTKFYLVIIIIYYVMNERKRHLTMFDFVVHSKDVSNTI